MYISYWNFIINDSTPPLAISTFYLYLKLQRIVYTKVFYCPKCSEHNKLLENKNTFLFSQKRFNKLEKHVNNIASNRGNYRNLMLKFHNNSNDVSGALFLVFDFTKIDLLVWSYQDLVIVTFFKGIRRVWHVVGERKEKNDSYFVMHTFNHWLFDLKQDWNFNSIIIQSDGAGKHFKNTSMMYFMKQIALLWQIRIVWNFFISYHGSNICDAEAASFKKHIDNSQNRLRYVPKRSKDFDQFYNIKDPKAPKLVLLNKYGVKDNFVKDEKFEILNRNSNVEYCVCQNITNYHCFLFLPDRPHVLGFEDAQPENILSEIPTNGNFIEISALILNFPNLYLPAKPKLNTNFAIPREDINLDNLETKKLLVEYNSTIIYEEEWDAEQPLTNNVINFYMSYLFNSLEKLRKDIVLHTSNFWSTVVSKESSAFTTRKNKITQFWVFPCNIFCSINKELIWFLLIYTRKNILVFGQNVNHLNEEIEEFVKL